VAVDVVADELVPPLAVRLPRPVSEQPHATPHVRSLRYRFKVCRIHAPRVAAEMVKH
jgi:hypothetical protein